MACRNALDAGRMPSAVAPAARAIGMPVTSTSPARPSNTRSTVAARRGEHRPQRRADQLPEEAPGVHQLVRVAPKDGWPSHRSARPSAANTTTSVPSERRNTTMRVDHRRLVEHPRRVRPEILIRFGRRRRPRAPDAEQPHPEQREWHHEAQRADGHADRVGDHPPDRAAAVAERARRVDKCDRDQQQAEQIAAVAFGGIEQGAQHAALGLWRRRRREVEARFPEEVVLDRPVLRPREAVLRLVVPTMRQRYQWSTTASMDARKQRSEPARLLNVFTFSSTSGPYPPSLRAWLGESAGGLRPPGLFLPETGWCSPPSQCSLGCGHALATRRLPRPPDRRGDAARRDRRSQLLRPVLLQPVLPRQGPVRGDGPGAVPEPGRRRRLRAGLAGTDHRVVRSSRPWRGSDGHHRRTHPGRGARRPQTPPGRLRGRR